MSYITRFFARPTQLPSTSLDDMKDEPRDMSIWSRERPYSSSQHVLGKGYAQPSPPPLPALVTDSREQDKHVGLFDSPEHPLSASTQWEDTEESAGTTPRQSYWTCGSPPVRDEQPRPVLRIDTQSTPRTGLTTLDQNPFSPKSASCDRGVGLSTMNGNSGHASAASRTSEEEPRSRFSAWTSTTSGTPKTIRGKRLTRQSASTVPASGISPSSAVVDLVYQFSSPVRRELDTAGPEQNRLALPGWRPRSSVYSQATIFLGDGTSFQMPPSPVPPIPKIAPHWIADPRYVTSPQDGPTAGKTGNQTWISSPQTHQTFTSEHEYSIHQSSENDAEGARSKPCNLKIDTSKTRPPSDGYWVQGILTAHLLTPSPGQQVRSINGQHSLMTPKVADQKFSFTQSFWSPLSTKDETLGNDSRSQGEEIIMFGLEEDTNQRHSLRSAPALSRSLIAHHTPSIIDQADAVPIHRQLASSARSDPDTPRQSSPSSPITPRTVWSGFVNDRKDSRPTFASRSFLKEKVDSDTTNAFHLASKDLPANSSKKQSETLPRRGTASPSRNSVYQEYLSPQPPPYTSKAPSSRGSSKIMPHEEQNNCHQTPRTIPWPSFGGSHDSPSEESIPRTPDEEDVKFYASITGWNKPPGTVAAKAACVATERSVDRKSFPKPPTSDRRRLIKRRNLIRWFIFSAFLICIMIILAVVLATTLHTKHPSSPPISFWVNGTGFPPMPTGTLTVAQPSAAVENAGCVNPSTIWSCALPKEQQAAISPNAPDQPNFRFDIRYLNSSSNNNASDVSWIPTPAAPSLEDQIFLGNTTDGITTSLYEGEETPFYITFMSTLQTSSSSSASLIKRSQSTNPSSASSATATSSRSISSAIPAPDVDADGDPAPANLLPYPVSQPLRLYNRGLPTEHYGFYNYFDRSIFLSSIDGVSSADLDGGSPQDQATLRCTWAQTRFLVQIWTRRGNATALLPTPVSAISSSSSVSPSVKQSSSAAASATASALNSTTFSRPGTFPYPVTITLDRHGGNDAEKMIYCYGINSTTRAIVPSDNFYQVEDRGFGGTLVNPASLESSNETANSVASRSMIAVRDTQYGGIDGGTGGCSCQWQNFLAQS